MQDWDKIEKQLAWRNRVLGFVKWFFIVYGVAGMLRMIYVLFFNK